MPVDCRQFDMQRGRSRLAGRVESEAAVLHHDGQCCRLSQLGLDKITESYVVFHQFNSDHRRHRYNRVLRQAKGIVSPVKPIRLHSFETLARVFPADV